MILKTEKNKRKYIPTTVGDSLASVNKKFLYKFGKLDYIIHSKWPDIVGKFFVNHSEPLKINYILYSINDKGDKIYDKFLHVNVSPPAAIEFQHFQDKITEKINSYFGYKAIKGIKIHQHFVKIDTYLAKKINNNMIDKKKITSEVKKDTPDLINKDLEESIVKLGLSIRNVY